MAEVRKPSLVPDSVAAARQGQDVEIAHVAHSVVGHLFELAAPAAGEPGEPGALEPVLLLARPTVVRGAAVGKDRGQPRAALVPGSRSRRQHRPVPVPRHTIGGRGIGGRHAVLLVGDVERVAADPRLPPAIGGAAHDRILHADHLVTREDGAGLGGREVGGVIGLQQVDPPVLARRLGGRADVQAPPAVIGADDRRALHGRRVEPRLVELGDGRQMLAIRGACDDRRPASLCSGPDAVRDHEAAIAVERGTRCTGPPSVAFTGRGYRDGSTPAARQRKVVEAHAPMLPPASPSRNLAPWPHMHSTRPDSRGPTS
jgi:hypothetical protein